MQRGPSHREFTLTIKTGAVGDHEMEIVDDKIRRICELVEDLDTLLERRSVFPEISVTDNKIIHYQSREPF